MNTASRNAEALREQGQFGNTNSVEHADSNSIHDLFPESLLPVVSASRTTPPIVSGQCAQVLDLIRKHQPILSFVLTADHAIPEAAARVHDLRALGFDVRTRIVPKVIFRGRERRNAAFYSLSVPEWPAPGFVSGGV